MTPDVATELRQRAILSASAKGFRQQSEDIAHDALLRWLEGFGRHQTVDQAVTDAIRGEFGRPGTPGHEQRRNLEQRYECMDGLARLPSREVTGDPLAEFERIIERLDRGDQTLCRLRFVWGFNEKEIGYLLGVTVSRISQRIRGVCARLQGALLADEINGEVGHKGLPEGSSCEADEGASGFAFLFEDFVLD